MLAEAERTIGTPQDWSTLRLDREGSIILADAAHMLRFRDSDGETQTPIEAEQLLLPRRHDDPTHDFSTV